MYRIYQVTLGLIKLCDSTDLHIDTWMEEKQYRGRSMHSALKSLIERSISFQQMMLEQLNTDVNINEV